MRKISYLLLITLLGLTIFSCKDDEEIVKEDELKKVALTDTTAAHIMIVNLLTDDSHGIMASFEGVSSAHVMSGQNSAYTLFAEATGNFAISVHEGGTILEEEKYFSKGINYTAYVYGTTSSPKLTILQDNLTPSDNVEDFKASGLNFSDIDTVSLQALYPQYQGQIDAYNQAYGTAFEPWATASNWFENIQQTYSIPVNYGGNIPLTIRAIKGKSEFLREYTSFDDPNNVGQKIFYHLESTAPLHTFENSVTLAPLSVYTLVFYGTADNYKYVVINHTEASK